MKVDAWKKSPYDKLRRSGDRFMKASDSHFATLISFLCPVSDMTTSSNIKYTSFIMLGILYVWHAIYLFCKIYLYILYTL